MLFANAVSNYNIAHRALKSSTLCHYDHISDICSWIHFN